MLGAHGNDPYLWAPGVVRVQLQAVGGPRPYLHPQLLCRQVWHVHTHQQISTGQLLLGTGHLRNGVAVICQGWFCWAVSAINLDGTLLVLLLSSVW